jgi:hypothetical protein
MDVPGETPRSPITVVVPNAENVTSVPPRIAKPEAAPRSTVAAVAFWCRNATAAATIRAILGEKVIFIEVILIEVISQQLCLSA